MKNSTLRIRVALLVGICTALIAGTARGQVKDSLKSRDVFSMSLNELMNVEVISASKISEPIREVPATVQVITAEQIRDRGYFTLDEALSDLPGFQFRNMQGFNSYVIMRGAPSQNNLILVLVDGIQINELNSGGFYGGGQYNLSNVDRIEVVYGPASALYGTNAVSGIINIITKNPGKGPKGRASLLGGRFRTGLADAAYQTFNPDKQIGFSISGMVKTSGKADLGGERGDHYWTDSMENFEHDLALLGKFIWKNLTAGWEYQEKKASMSTYYPSAGTKYLDRNTLWDIAFLNGYVKYNHTLGKNLDLFSTLYYRNATVKPNTIDHIERSTDSTPGNQVGYYRPNQLAGLENQVNWIPFNHLVLTAGLVGEVEQLAKGFSVTNSLSDTIQPPRPAKPGMLVNGLLSYYAQANLSIGKHFNIIGGVRHDFSSYYGQVLTPRTGIVFNYDKLTAKLLYNNAFRAPRPWDYTYGTGNPDLKPEKIQAFEVFCSYALMENLQVGISAYRDHMHDKLVKEINGSVDHWINLSELSTNGIEVFSNYVLNQLTLYLNYTLNDSYNQDGLFVPEISLHTANAGITYSFDQHFRINLRSNYLGPRRNPTTIPTTGTDRIDPALVFHGAITYLDFHGFDFQLKVNNILDTEYYHPNNRFAGRYRQPQRFLSMSVTYNLN
jgi:iron complex outermembrane receptor protein